MSNQYYHTDTTGYNVVQSQFQETLRREGTSINDYWKPDITYPCIFRQNKDYNQPTDHVTIFYPADTGIHAGQLLSFRGQVYLTLNQETIENGIYYRSSLVKTNTEIFTYSNKKEIHIPAHANEITSVSPDTGTALTTVGGTIQLTTEDCSLSRNIGIDSEFTSDMSGRWKIINDNYRNGIAYLYAERIQAGADPIYSLAIIGEPEYTMGDTAKLTVVAQRDGLLVSNPTIKWSSPGTNIASITADGQVTFSTVGEVILTATWTEHGVTANITIAVVEEVASLRCEISGRSDIRAGLNRTYTAIFYDADNNIVDDVAPIWSLSDVPGSLSGKIRITSTNGMTATVTADAAAIGTIFSLVLTDSSGVYHATLKIEVIDTY